VDLDGDPMCRACADYLQNAMVKGGHARLPETPIVAKPQAVAAPALCPHGCGRPARHRGRCAGAGRQARNEAREQLIEKTLPPLKSPELDIPVRRYVPGERQAIAEIPALVRLCAQGCGRPVHLGRCFGVSQACHLTQEERAARAKKAAAVRREHTGSANGHDALECEVVDEEALPSVDAMKFRRAGRLGKIWDKLDELEPPKYLKIVNRDRNHLGTTSRELRKSAKKMGVVLELEPRGTFLFVRYKALHAADAPDGARAGARA
jgi:hypothetical protein